MAWRDVLVYGHSLTDPDDGGQRRREGEPRALGEGRAKDAAEPSPGFTRQTGGLVAARSGFLQVTSQATAPERRGCQGGFVTLRPATPTLLAPPPTLLTPGPAA